jgi:hypothetical protein
VLVYTDYGYGHIDLAQHGKDLTHNSELLPSILSLLADPASPTD